MKSGRHMKMTHVRDRRIDMLAASILVFCGVMVATSLWDVISARHVSGVRSIFITGFNGVTCALMATMILWSWKSMSHLKLLGTTFLLFFMVPATSDGFNIVQNAFGTIMNLVDR